MLAVLTGCPKRFDPRAETVRQSPDPDADHEYHEAKARLDIGDAREAEVRFADFLRKHPTDPLAPSARIGQARAELLLNQPKKAKEILEPVAAPQDDPTAARARYLLGLTLHKTGDWARSRELLRPFATSIASGDDAIELHAVLADDAAHLDDWQDALVEYSAFFGGARPAEKLYLEGSRLRAVREAFAATKRCGCGTTLPHDTLAAAYLGKRVARPIGAPPATSARRRDPRRVARARASARASRSRASSARRARRAAGASSAWCCRSRDGSARSASGRCAARCWPPI